MDHKSCKWHAEHSDCKDPNSAVLCGVSQTSNDWQSPAVVELDPAKRLQHVSAYPRAIDISEPISIQANDGGS